MAKFASPQLRGRRQGLRDPVSLRRADVRALRGRPGRPRGRQTARASPPSSRSWPGSNHRTSGTRSVRGGIRVGYVPQDPVLLDSGTHRRGSRRCVETLAGRRRRPTGRAALRSPSGRGGFADGRAGGGWAVRRVEEAARHRPCPRGRTGCAPDGRAHQPPRRRRASCGSSSCWRSACAGRPPREPRSLLPRARGHPHARARSAPIPTASSRRDGTLQRVPRPSRRLPARAGRLRGIARQYRPA